jgi:hypothetical protein
MMDIKDNGDGDKHSEEAEEIWKEIRHKQGTAFGSRYRYFRRKIQIHDP